MSSAVDTLLEAARFIELQEQHGFREGWVASSHNNPSAEFLHRHQQPQNNIRITNNDSNNSINNHQVNTNNNSINNHRHNNQNHYSRGNDNSENYNNNNNNNNNNRRNNENFNSQNHRNNNTINNINNRILSPRSSPTSQNNHIAQHKTSSGINIKTLNSTSHSIQNELISNLRTTLIEERIDNGVTINNNNNTNNSNGNGNNAIEIITNGKQRHNSSSSSTSPRKSGININNNIISNNINIINSNNNITTILNSTNNNSTHAVMSTTTEDSSQSSLNLSSSSYLSGSPNNNHNSSTSSILNSDNLLPFQLTSSSSSIITTAASSTGSGRRRTISNTSDGSQGHRNSSAIRPGTREIHNKLEKHRRAHLKECFEQLKVQLQLKDEEKKKTSNLAILGAAYRHVMALRRKERELEQQVELLAKEKINAQKKIVSLKRELVAKYDNIDFSSIVSDVNNVTTNIVNTTNNICNINNSSPPQQQQQHHQIAPLNLNRTSSPQTMLLSPNNKNIKINLNNDGFINHHVTLTKDFNSIENNKSLQSDRKILHHQYSTDKPRDLTTNASSHKVVIQSNNNYNNINNNIKNSTTSITNVATQNLNIKEDPDHSSQKVIKQYNLIALAPVDKDNKIITSASLPIPQVVTTGGGLVIPMLSSQALRVIGPNNLPTIEFSSPTLQNHIQNSIPSLTSVTSGQQLQKLFINGDCTGTATISAHPALTHVHESSLNDNKNCITSEINRLPGGAELNILPASVTGTTIFRGNEKLTFVNNAITLKNSTANNNSSRAVHVVTTSNHQNSTSNNGGCLTPIVVTQGQQVNNITQLIATAPQLNKMNISVTGHHHHHHHQTDETKLINATQYIHTGPMKQMVVAVANNATPTNNSSSIKVTSKTESKIGKI